MISSDAVALVKHFEGCRLMTYRCPAGVLTIGYGHTGPDVRGGMIITQARAEELLNADLQPLASFVQKMVARPLAQHQLDALACFVFSIGRGAFEQSTMLGYLRGGQWASAAGEFQRWVKADGRVLPGLVSRRAAERSLFEGKQP